MEGHGRPADPNERDFVGPILCTLRDSRFLSKKFPSFYLFLVRSHELGQAKQAAIFHRSERRASAVTIVFVDCVIFGHE